MRPSYRMGIWSRLLMAFSFISSITLLVGIIALLIFDSSEQVVEQLAQEHIPELVQVSDFVKLGGQIVAVAPSILSTDDESTREAVRRDLDDLVNRLKQRLSSLSVARPTLHQSLENLVKRLETNLTGLQLSVNRQSALQHRLNRMTERLRWLYIDLIGEIDPLKQDYTYDLEAEIERVIDAAREGRRQISADELQASQSAQESVEKVRSDGVLLVSLMVQGASLETMSQLDNLSTLSADAVATLRQDMGRLKGDIGALTLRSVLEDIYQLAEGDDSVFAVRRAILSNDIRGREILKQNRFHVDELESVINDIVVQAEAVAGKAATSTRQNLRRAKTSMIFMVLISLVTVVAVMWFYVRGNIVARLSALSTSMRAIAKGDLDHRVPEAGSDEIGRMAVALRVFRDTAQAVREKSDHLRRINAKLREEVKERRRIENELVQSGKLAALGRFSASIAHELNQPLSAIRYYLHNAGKLLERGQTRIHQDNLAKMDELVERMAKMINHLKTFARYQSDLLEQVDVTRAIDKALELLSGRLEDGGVEVVRRYPPEGCTACANAVRLEQVLVNILSNGIDAAGGRGRHGLLTVAVAENETTLTIAISDNGSGIQAKPPEIVFDPFYTTKEVGRGLGLGLSIAYNIIKGFGGRITAANQEAGGACFSISLPKSKEVKP